MKIVEGLKKLKLILKKMESNSKYITEYSSKLSTEKASFGSEAEQMKYVQGLVQSNLDLAEEYLRIKKNIDYTNLSKTITIENLTKTVADFLLLKRTLGKLIVGTFKAMNDSNATFKGRSFSADGKVVVEKMYDEKKKMDQLRDTQDMLDSIDAKLEIFNATEDLIEQF